MVSRKPGESEEDHRERGRVNKADNRKKNKRKKKLAEQHQQRKAKKEMENLLQSSTGSPIGSPEGLSFRPHPGGTPRGLPSVPTPSRAAPGTPLVDMTLNQLKTAKYDNKVHMIETSLVDTELLQKNAVLRHEASSELDTLFDNEIEARLRQQQQPQLVQAGRKLDFDYIPQVYSSHVRSPVFGDAFCDSAAFYDSVQDLEDDRKMPAKDTSVEKPAAKKRRTSTKKPAAKKTPAKKTPSSTKKRSSSKKLPPRSPATKGRAPLKEMDENPSPAKKLTKEERLAKRAEIRAKSLQWEFSDSIYKKTPAQKETAAPLETPPRATRSSTRKKR